MNPCIINVAIGHGYVRGQARLVRSIVTHDRKMPILTWQGWPESDIPQTSPYNAKAMALERAIAMGYDRILWLDASVILTGSPRPIFDRMETDGYFLLTSGYNCAQTCSDRILEYFQITRDTAEKQPDASSGCFGVNLSTDIGASFARMFIQSARDGMFEGSRNHDGQSQDPRFLFHRQDQSAAGLIAHHLGMRFDNLGEMVGYWKQGGPNQFVHFKGIDLH